MNSNEKLLHSLINRYERDKNTIGIIMIGSQAKGYQNNHSDIDLEIVVTTDKFNEIKKEAQHYIHTEEYDLIFKSIAEIKEKINSDKTSPRMLLFG